MGLISSRLPLSTTTATARISLATACAAMLAGCFTGVGLRGRDIPHPGVRTSWQAAGIRDERAAFESAFCSRFGMEAEGMPACASWSWPAPVAGTLSPAVDVAAPASGPRTVVVVPGIFGECVAEWVTPFSDAYGLLRDGGHTVLVAPVTGRGSAERNAAIIDGFLREHQQVLHDVVVIAYSKGFTDFMLAATSPQAGAWRNRIDAVVSVAGTANGSPLANRGHGLYGELLADLPHKACGPEDGGGVASLSYARAMDVRDRFLALESPIPVYAVAAVAEPGHVNPILGPFRNALAGIDDRNDGQVLLEDALVPGATLLGIYRADHWSIALPFERSAAWQVKPLSRNNRFPRRALATALVDYVPRRARPTLPVP